MSVVQHLGEKLEIKQAAPRFPGLGLAMYYLCHRKPFSDMLSSTIIPVVDGQIRRGHALIAMQGPRAVGYLGWALFSIDEALTHVHTGEPPEGATRDSGDVVWPMTVAANSPIILRALVRAARQMNVGRSIMTIRPVDGGSRLVPPILIVS
jgi:hemolysin-activating ACP:hemolysin acyltransferase